MTGQRADAILRSYGITDPSEIDVEAIAFDFGAIVREARLEGCAAHIIGRGDRAIITIDECALPGRKRFSIAHELAHWLWHRGQTQPCAERDLRRPWSALDKEAVANGFAADLLMPEFLIRPVLDGRPAAFSTVCEIETLFSVSQSAAALRLVQFSAHDSMVLYHDRTGRREWFRGSRRVDGVFYPSASLSTDSDAYGILRGQQGSPIPLTVDADDWIDHPSARDYEIKEHSISYGEGVLTLLWWKDTTMVDRLAG